MKLVYLFLFVVLTIPLAVSDVSQFGLYNSDIPSIQPEQQTSITFNNNTYGSNESDPIWTSEKGDYLLYTGATSNVDLGVYNLSTSKIYIGNPSGGADARLWLKSNAFSQNQIKITNSLGNSLFLFNEDLDGDGAFTLYNSSGTAKVFFRTDTGDSYINTGGTLQVNNLQFTASELKHDASTVADMTFDNVDSGKGFWFKDSVSIGANTGGVESSHKLYVYDIQSATTGTNTAFGTLISSSPTASSSKNLYGFKGGFSIAGANDLTGTQAGMLVTGRVQGTGGTATSANGIRIEVGSEASKNVTTLRGIHNIQSLTGDGNITTVYGYFGGGFSDTGAGTANTFSHIWLQEITAATTNYGIVADSDYWGLTLGAGQNSEIYYDGTNLIFNTNKTGNGLAWFSKNVSATGFMTRTSVFDKSKKAKDYIKDADEYLSNGVINHSKFYGSSTFEITDYSRPEKEYYDEEVCTVSEENENETSCETNKMERVIYPYKTTETGVDLGKEIDVLRQRLSEYESCLEASKSFEEYKICLK